MRFMRRFIKYAKNGYIAVLCIKLFNINVCKFYKENNFVIMQRLRLRETVLLTRVKLNYTLLFIHQCFV